MKTSICQNDTETHFDQNYFFLAIPILPFDHTFLQMKYCSWRCVLPLSDPPPKIATFTFIGGRKWANSIREPQMGNLVR